MKLAETLESEKQAAELILPTKHALDGIEAFLEYVSIEQRLPATFGEFPASGIGIDIGNHAAVEDRLPVLPAIVGAVQADNRSLKVKANRTGCPHHVWQGCPQEWRFVVISGSRDKRRDDIAVPVTEGYDLIAFDLLVSVEADVVASFLRRRGRAIAMDDGHVEKVGLTKPQYHDRENDIETAVGLPPSKSAINTGVMDLRTSFRILFNRQCLPLISNVQQFQDVVEQRVQGQLRRRAPAPNGQVGQDKLPELLEAQFRRNTPGLHTFRHYGPRPSDPLSVRVEVSQLHLSRAARWPPPTTPPLHIGTHAESPPHARTLTLRRSFACPCH